MGFRKGRHILGTQAGKLVTENYRIKITGYPNLHGTLRIALAADLHDHDPGPLLSALRDGKPDLILIAGDLMERKWDQESGWVHEDYEWLHTGRKIKLASWAAGSADRLLGIFSRRRPKMDWDEANGRAFLYEAVGIAPLYMGLGNHEWRLLPEDYKAIRDSGAALLDNSDAAAHTKAGKIRIGGLSTKHDLGWLSHFSKKDGCKILICHHPEYYAKLIKNKDFDCFDLIVSGHCHGGQWRIGGRGLFAPGQGILPKYSHGIYPANGGSLVITAGCANTARVPRFGNPCELIIVECSFG